ncbi:MAG: 30S ribosomal protein S9 [Candidatus Fermentibacteraceae bacterium]|nr:30S ribosomal protein S9 [Candidatus Fermentibacteraceae bacterium]
MEQYTGIGRRKSSTARCYLRPGSGKVVINHKAPGVYFSVNRQKDHALEPLETVKVAASYDLVVNVKGGGITGQAGAVRMGLARALVEVNPEFRHPLKAAGMLRRDPRVVERKKYGQPKARKRFQFSKR